MNAELVPIGFGKIQPVILRSFLDVRERQRPVLLWHIDDLIKSCHGVAHMVGVGQWLFTLPRKREDAIGQITSLGQEAMPLERLPRRLYRSHLTHAFLSAR